MMDSEVTQRMQKVFDATAKHLAQQGKRSMMSITSTKFPDRITTICAYRGDDGLKCAVGHLIPDEAYSSNMENCGFGSLLNGFWSVLPEVLRDTALYDLFVQLQRLHDCDIWTESQEDFQKQFARVAGEFRLSMDYVQTLELQVPVAT